MDIAIVVNLRARRGSHRVAEACGALLPRAKVMVSSSLEQALEFADRLRNEPPSLVLSAGGDGTAVSLINALRGPQTKVPVIGLLPLGTGNGWANVTGAPPWKKALAALAAFVQRGAALPRRRFDLVEAMGSVAPFAGTGWDAEIIDDFHAQKTSFGLLPKAYRNGVAGYMQGLFTRTIPRHLRTPQVDVTIVNTGDDALSIDDQGRAVPLPNGGKGALLYRGPTSVCAAGTSGEWGFGFRAFPFAGLVPRRFNLRVYAGTAVEATMRMRSLWLGEHPLPKMHTWMLSRCKATFSRPVPFQIGGDRVGLRSEVEYAVAPDQVDLLDWRALR